MRIANEKTLELNITHQLLSAYSQSLTVGSTLQSELQTGVDSAIFTPYQALLLQYKASDKFRGTDGQDAFFNVNNNSNGDQHIKLKALTQGLAPDSVFYAFPIVISDQYFQQIARTVVQETIFVNLKNTPDYPQFVKGKAHVSSNGNYVFNSEPFKGVGLTAKALLKRLREGEIGHKVEPEKVPAFIERLEDLAQQTEIRRRSIRIAFFHKTSPFVYHLSL